MKFHYLAYSVDSNTPQGYTQRSMASLTETAYQTRRIINWTILFIIAYFIIRLMWSFFVAMWVYIFPAKPAPPNHAFGKLPRVVFPTPESSPAAQLTFTLQTISGTLPEASSSARVYFMPKAGANLLAINNTQNFVKKLGFDATPIQETRTIYRFNDNEFPLRKIRYDIVSNNFILRYGFEQNTALFSEGTLRDPQAIEQEAINYLDNNAIYPSDFVHGTQKITYLKLVGNSLVPVANLSQVDAMRVDFFRGSVHKFPLLTPNPDEGQIQLLFSGSKTPKKHVLQLTFTYWPIDESTFATYQLKPMANAWQELQNQGGYIAKYPINGSTTATIRNVYLGYYDSFDPQTYLQPIYVFIGDYGFAAYVPAISPEWVE